MINLHKRMRLPGVELATPAFRHASVARHVTHSLHYALGLKNSERRCITDQRQNTEPLHSYRTEYKSTYKNGDSV